MYGVGISYVPVALPTSAVTPATPAPIATSKVLNGIEAIPPILAIVVLIKCLFPSFSISYGVHLKKAPIASLTVKFVLL